MTPAEKMAQAKLATLKTAKPKNDPRPTGEFNEPFPCFPASYEDDEAAYELYEKWTKGAKRSTPGDKP